MHDFMCTNLDEIHYEILRNRNKLLKDTKKGRMYMSKIMDDIRKMYEKEGVFTVAGCLMLYSRTLCKCFF